MGSRDRIDAGGGGTDGSIRVPVPPTIGHGRSSTAWIRRTDHGGRSLDAAASERQPGRSVLRPLVPRPAPPSASPGLAPAAPTPPPPATRPPPPPPRAPPPPPQCHPPPLEPPAPGPAPLPPARQHPHPLVHPPPGRPGGAPQGVGALRGAGVARPGTPGREDRGCGQSRQQGRLCEGVVGEHRVGSTRANANTWHTRSSTSARQAQSHPGASSVERGPAAPASFGERLSANRNIPG